METKKESFEVQTDIGSFSFPMCVNEAVDGLKVPTLAELGYLFAVLTPKGYPDGPERAQILKEPRMAVLDRMLRQGMLVGNTICRGIPKEQQWTGPIFNLMATWVQEDINTDDGVVVFDALLDQLRGVKGRVVDFVACLKQAAIVQRFAAMGRLGSLADPPTGIKLIKALVSTDFAVEALYFFCMKIYQGYYSLWATIPEVYGCFNVYLELKNGQPYPCQDDQKDPHYLLIRPGDEPKQETVTVLLKSK